MDTPSIKIQDSLPAALSQGSQQPTGSLSKIKETQETGSTDRVTLSIKFAGSSDCEECEKEQAGKDARIQNQLELTEEERRIVQQLQARDREVRAHEQAHQAAAGQYSRGGPNFEYETGPDGQRYAVAGEVKIDTSPVSGDPEATIRKAQTIKRAAVAPANPSSQDRQVAAQAAQMEAQARQQLTEQRAEEQKEVRESSGHDEISSISGNAQGPNNAPSADRSQNSQLTINTSGNKIAQKFYPPPSPSPGNLIDIIS